MCPFATTVCPFPIVSDCNHCVSVFYCAQLALCPTDNVSDCHCVRLALCMIITVSNSYTHSVSVSYCVRLGPCPIH
ncbi:hypothetical protein X777_16441 [Ooceraea biroi]|uniref:Uncharacterized protein n=1 Tax=Ooceraea biroi TaxID=2015173 RepID=A0A026WVN3_OOCBI|nr:hypothetical protein X777_16441 [Ooceraea biroi]